MHAVAWRKPRFLVEAPDFSRGEHGF